ncbi:TMEM165/GDT1 family protein [Patescibacteria group bacterium]|nr:TMEM165/GDT1 family protein [Patescibacteria group bacterium]MBU4015979.1 TMEM165/GDT1 family protein [Patescibacteria group bacterium]MBU4098653.1 TMEM165/GDT1 family protein [Patescibacteria group bacterium]
MFQSIFVPFLSIGLAELLDKSQLMVILLASRTKKQKRLFSGVMLAFIIVDGSAILAGSLLTGLIQSLYIKLIAGLGFIIFGILSLRKSSEEEQKYVVMENPFLSGLGVIFLSEWGDKTQIASGLFATQYSPLPVFIGTILALGLLSLMAIYFGKFISGKFEKRIINKVSGIIFLLIGFLFLFF